MELDINENFSSTVSNHPVLFIINTQALISLGEMNANGDDIRFSRDCPNNFLSYWIESGINTVSTKIWVKFPIITPTDSGYLRMYYGDTSAIACSNMDSIFTTKLITTGNITLSGVQNYDYIKVNTGHTITVTAGTSLTFNSTYAIIQGDINGNGKGYAAPTTGVGNGPGAGGTSTNSGSGGGSYGGIGGTGGYDNNDTPGQGGPTYGTNSGTDIAMGSSGGSSDNTAGGNGGGSFKLTAKKAVVSGYITMDGNSGVLPGGSRGGGGGAGGGILIHANHLQITSSLTAKGGNGSVGTGSANDSGGGGGGGRIKIFHGDDYIMTGTTSVLGGIGTVFIDTASFTSSLVLDTFNYIFTYAFSDTICMGDSILIDSVYQTTAGTYTDSLADVFGCDSIVTTQLYVFTVDTSVSVSGYTLTAGATSATFQWYDCNTSAIISGETNNTFSPLVDGNYAVIVTQNNCTFMSSCYAIIGIGLGEQSVNRFSYYPNPTNNILYIDGFVSGHNYEVLITDICGKVKYRISQNSSERMDVSLDDLASGMYLLHISDLNNKTNYFSKIIKK